MEKPIISIQNLGKQYKLGTVGTGTLSHDLNRWWAKIRGKEDPFAKVGEVNDRSTKGESDYVWALQNINLEIFDGEVIGIIGKNGAGKSTLLKLLSRVTAPTEGSITCYGKLASLLEVGTGFHPELTGKENIYLNGAVLGMTKEEINRKFDEIVDFAGCARYIDTPVKRYSSGMTVRLGFAVAAHLEPDILVIDEVLAVGDAEFKQKAVGKMKEVSSQKGRTVLFVSHNMGSIKSLCQKVIVLDKGTVSFIGNVDEGINHYLSLNMEAKTKVFYNKENCIDGIYNVVFKSKKDLPLSNAIVGEPLKICIKYRNPNKRNYNIAIGFFDEFQNFMFSIRSDLKGVYCREKEGEICFLIDKWPLSSGIYSYNLAVHDAGAMIFNKKNAGSISVESGDYYGTGFLPGKKNSGFYIDFECN